MCSWDVKDFDGDGVHDFLACTTDPDDVRNMVVRVRVWGVRMYVDSVYMCVCVLVWESERVSVVTLVYTNTNTHTHSVIHTPTHCHSIITYTYIYSLYRIEGSISTMCVYCLCSLTA